MSSSTLTLARIALRNTRRNWRHSLAAALSIAVGVLALGMFDGYMDDLSGRSLEGYAQRSMYGDVLVEREGASSDEGRDDPQAHALTESDQAWLDAYLREHRREVPVRARFVNFMGMASAGKASTLFAGIGYDVREGQLLRGDLAWNVIAGQPLDPTLREQAAMGRALSMTLDCDPPPGPIALGPDGKPSRVEKDMRCAHPNAQLTVTTPKGQLNAVEVAFRGVLSVQLRDVDEMLLMVPIEVAHEVLDHRGVSLYSLRLAKGVDAKAFSAQLMHEAKSAGVPLWAGPWQTHPDAKMAIQSVEMMQAYRGFILMVVLVVAGMSVATSMAKAVSERMREIGTMRSLGFLPRHVTLLFAFEAASLAAPSIAIGVALTMIAAAVINAMKLAYTGGLSSDASLLIIHVTPAAYASAAAFLLFVTVSATLLVARKGARSPITSALGHT